ncbi:hypothetical protein F1728_13850 [Gimesia benthica]|uniref:Uncharacterized protein n=1 Tax=Gimesia benthica TaxID=2608982 RepID=A0A6I6ABH0_9PLAN|nr:hypothetical protein [Gimesia benthica]QGQ23697.1 hypothetical protein F1728_13850 [Gimesia benthica]
MSILHNAIQAMECGIEDYGVGTDSRLKSAIRNVHAGVLLLFKEKLSRLSPEGTDDVLLKQHVRPAFDGNKIIWKGRGKKTVDFQSIKNRFKDLNILVDWTNFDSINSIRNEIEHYYTTANKHTIEEAIVKSFVLASDFLEKHLGLDAKSHFSQDTWNVFIEVKAVYDKEKERCIHSHANLETSSNFICEFVDTFSCDNCGSDLICITEYSSGECRACSKSWNREDLIVRIAEKGSWITSTIGDENDPTVINCPNCGEFAFSTDEMICGCCGDSQQPDCERCGTRIPVEELDGSQYCGYCNYQMSKYE